MKKKAVLPFAIGLAIIFLLSSCKTTQLQTVQKARSIPELATDTSGYGKLFGNSIGNDSGGFGLSGTGQGGGGAGNVSGLGGLGTISPGGLGYGSGKKKESNRASANDSRSTDRKSQTTNAGINNEKPSQPSLSTSLASVGSGESDTEKIQRLDAFKASPTKTSSSDASDVKREVKSAGVHPKEMPAGNYVAVESFIDEAQANRFASRLINLGFDPNVPRYVSADDRWYVCLEVPAKSSQIAERINHYRTMEIFESVWVLTIR